MHKSEFKKAFGVSPDELMEGFTFVEKRDELFVFTDSINEINFNIDGIRSLINSKSQMIINELLVELDKLGIYRLDFTLFDYENQKYSRYSVSEVKENSNYIIVKGQNGKKLKVHYSVLIEAQFESLQDEIKNIERNFFTSDLKHTLLRLQTLRSQINRNHGNQTRNHDVELAFSRIKILFDQKLSSLSKDDPIRSEIENFKF